MKNKLEKSTQTISQLRVAIASVDAVLFAVVDGMVYTLLVPVHRPPFYVHMHGLPGGVIGPDEDATESATRHLKEKAGVTQVHIEQLYTFSAPERDKRSRSISIAYMALVSPDQFSAIAEKTGGKWFPVKMLPTLAYDHKDIIAMGLERLQGKLAYTNIVAHLLPEHFTLTELQHMYETILERKFDKRNFRKKMVSIGLVKEVGKKKKTIHKPAELYSFVKKDLTVIPEIRSAL
ncbi:MAG: hypothetical protein RLZZ347_103 [Candidatus Parcubacteria bacterium]|jgi:8-oxo-dGTP diphosphatase